MRRAAKVDANHAECGETLRALGYTAVDSHALGHSFPDWVAGRNGVTVFVEMIGADSHPHTIREHEDRRLGWKGGPWLVARTIDELLVLLRSVEVL